MHAQRRRVLIADDDRDGALTLSTSLELEGYEVRTVHGGQEALDAARAFKPPAPAPALRRRLPGAHRRNRLETQATDKMLANLAGFDYHVAKPYDPNDLVRLLAKVRPAAR